MNQEYQTKYEEPFKEKVIERRKEHIKEFLNYVIIDFEKFKSITQYGCDEVIEFLSKSCGMELKEKPKASLKTFGTSGWLQKSNEVSFNINHFWGIGNIFAEIGEETGHGLHDIAKNLAYPNFARKENYRKYGAISEYIGKLFSLLTVKEFMPKKFESYKKIVAKLFLSFKDIYKSEKEFRKNIIKKIKEGIKRKDLEGICKDVDELWFERFNFELGFKIKSLDKAKSLLQYLKKGFSKYFKSHVRYNTKYLKWSKKGVDKNHYFGYKKALEDFEKFEKLTPEKRKVLISNIEYSKEHYEKYFDKPLDEIIEKMEIIDKQINWKKQIIKNVSIPQK